MLIYKYFGGFNGFLTAVYFAYHGKGMPELITETYDFQISFDTEIIEIEPDEKMVELVVKGIDKKLSDGFEQIVRAYRSELPDRDTIIFDWLKFLFKNGGERTVSMVNQPEIIRFNDLQRKIGFEIHKMIAFLRFRELTNGIMYAPFRPEHDITAFLVDHFIERNMDQSFIIHDIGRNIFALYNTKEVQIVQNDDRMNVELTENEEIYRTLWQEYYKNVTIQSRTNKKAHRQFMPIRFWEFMNEVNNSF